MNQFFDIVPKVPRFVKKKFMIGIYILLFVIIALIVYLIYLVRFWGRTNIELIGDTYTGLNNVLCRILNQDRLKK